MFTHIIYYLLIFLITLSCVMFLTSSNKVYSVLYLISIYANTSILMINLGIVILGLFYFLVYIGAITVLFLFSIMILDLKDTNNQRDYSFFISFFLLTSLSLIFLLLLSESLPFIFQTSQYEYLVPTKEMLQVLGLILYGKYSFFILISALMLFVAMIGCIYLVNFKKGFYIKKQMHTLTRYSTVYNVLLY